MWAFEVQKPFPKSFKTSSKQVWKWQDLETKKQIKVMDRDAYVDGEIPYNEPGWKEVTKNNGNHTVSSTEASLAEKK